MSVGTTDTEPGTASRAEAGHAAPGARRPVRRRALRWALALLALILAGALAVGVEGAVRRTLEPRPDGPARVDALLVLYSQPAVYDAALDLLGRGVADRVFVSSHLGPDGHEKFCGEPARTDPRLAGVTVECFSPDPVTTQGEVMYAGGRMRELGLHDLGVLTFGEHLERSRVLAERCWPPEEGSVRMYEFDAGYDGAQRARQAAYAVLAWAKVGATPGCDQELPGVVRWPLDVLKGMLGMPVETAVPRPGAGRGAEA